LCLVGTQASDTSHRGLPVDEYAAIKRFEIMRMIRHCRCIVVEPAITGEV
jgi:hypothetical protein